VTAKKLKRVGIFAGIMNRSLVLAIVLSVLFSCQKTDLSDLDPQNAIDKDKLTDKDWYLGGKQVPQLITIRFQSDGMAVITKCVRILQPYQFETQRWPWSMIGKDSAALSTSHFRIYSMNDSVLVTSNWVVGGISDTTRQTFRTY
jgi:hypothetical protein